jgi:hypothetical protein
MCGLGDHGGDTSGTKFDVTVADKKYSNALEFPGLRLDVSFTGKFKKGQHRSELF